MRRLAKNALGAAAGLMIDRALGEPAASIHPVALFGTTMTRLESVTWTDNPRSQGLTPRARGVGYTAVGVSLGWVAGKVVRSTAVAVAIAVAGRELRHIAGQIADVADDLPTARQLLPSLVGRDPSQLDESGVAAAVIESLAENTVDAVVAPVFWSVVAGAPGALAYRAVNTMDAMVGHKSDRYVQFGWASARLDDAANYVPARLFYGLVQLVSLPERQQIRTAVRSTAAAHPSPNAGVAESAVAGALGIELGGPLRYGDVHENRPILGFGSRPTPTAIPAAITLVDQAELLLAVALAAVGIVARRARIH